MMLEVATVSTQKFLPNVSNLTLLRDGSWLGADGQNKVVLKRWVRLLNPKGDVTMQCNNTFELPNQGFWLTGMKLAEGKNSSFFCYMNFDIIRWNYKTGQKEMTYNVRSSKFSRTRELAILQEDLFATVNGTQDITLWQLDMKDPIETLSHPTDITGLCSMAAGRQFASRSECGTINIWDVGSRFCIKTIKSKPIGNDSPPCYELFEWGSGRVAASSSWDTTFEVFDVDSGTKVLERKGTGMLLNPEVVLVEGENVSYGPFCRPVVQKQLLKQNGDVIYTFKERDEVSALMELHPGVFAVVFSWEVDVGTREVTKQEVKIMRWKDERYIPLLI